MNRRRRLGSSVVPTFVLYLALAAVAVHGATGEVMGWGTLVTGPSSRGE